MDTLPLDSAEQTTHVISVISGDEFKCSPEISLLRGMERARANLIPVGCRGGGCGVCKIKVISGEFSRKVMSKAHISEEDRDNGYVLACRVFPRGDMVISIAPKPNV